MSETESSAAAAPRKPRRLRGHKKGAVTCCVAASSRPGVVASSGEVWDSTRIGLSPREGDAIHGFTSRLRLPFSEQRVASGGSGLWTSVLSALPRGALR
ncbi:hypothetical protein E2562_000549 [Oryza meyeriana var. granulata]|uniref:Uncharacterized protein n=1 Tax=Oryza meyeriana var. granulata TaxID=110450 RepID=A0A6G1DSV0_9ORYZ|nr:hypothetical protein E2562_000549 [Oryza meyeriana var. granulata]